MPQRRRSAACRTAAYGRSMSGVLEAVASMLLIAMVLKIILAALLGGLYEWRSWRFLVRIGRRVVGRPETEAPPTRPIEQIADGKARNFVLQMRAGRFHGFAVRDGDHVSGFVDQCPHAGLPLAQQLDDYLTPDGSHIRCSWHGAIFRRDDGVCVGGSCVGQRIAPWPLAIAEGDLPDLGLRPRL